jgi:transposase-like protein
MRFGFEYFSPTRARNRIMKSTNMLERFNEGIKRRNRVVRIFPNDPLSQRNGE